MNPSAHSRRQFLRAAVALGGAGVLQACGSTAGSATPVQPRITPAVRRPASGNNVLRIFAASGYAEHANRIEIGLRRLYDAGFTITNQQAAYRRYQRFAGSDAERIADLQDVALGRVATPKVLMGLRGGYGAVRLLPHVDWASLGTRMREQGTLLFGFSDTTAIQMALLARGNMPSFAGPMLYSEFGKPQPSVYTMQSFIDSTTRNFPFQPFLINFVRLDTDYAISVIDRATFCHLRLKKLATNFPFFKRYLPDFQSLAIICIFFEQTMHHHIGITTNR